MEIFKLFGSILVNSDEADKSMHKTEENAGKVADKLGNGIKTAAKWGTAIVTGTTAAVGGMMKFAESSAATADNIDKMSQKLGISRESFQELDFIMSQSGTSIDSFQGGMKTLLGNMDKVSEGNKTAIDNFEKLGISVQNADGTLRDQEDVLYDSIRAFQEMDDSAEKTRLATELFGKSGAELMPLLNGAAGSMDEMKQQAHDLGLVLSDEMIDSGVELTDSLDQTKRAFESIVTQLGGALMPLVTQASDYIQQSLPQIQEMIANLSPILTEMFEKLLPPLMQLAEQLFPVLMDLIVQLLPPISEIISALLPILIELISAIAPVLSPILQLISPLIELVVLLIKPIAEMISSVLPGFIEIVTQVISVAIKPLKVAFTVMGEVISSVLKNALGTVTNIFNNIKGVFDGLITFIKGVFTGNWKMAFQGLTDIVKNIFGGIVNIVKYPINSMISLINGFINGLNRIKIPDWVPAVGGYGLNIPNIPMLAKGGEITESGNVIVGEQGPEMLQLNAGAKVIPLDNTKSNENNINGIDDIKILMKNMFEYLQSMMPQMANTQIVTDTGVLVGQIAPAIDIELGKIAGGKRR